MANKKKPESKLTEFQRFETESIHRSMLKGAPYNPRVISKENKKRLIASLKKHGLVEPLVWNKRTGNMVSGHQRLSALDTLEGTKDYELVVSVVDVDEREEKILNVQLNNEFMQGDWDLDLLGELKLNDKIDFEEMGFAEGDAELLFMGDERFTGLFENKEVTHEKGQLEKIKQDRKKQMEDLADTQTTDFYFVVVCKDQDDKMNYLEKLGYPPTEQYVHSAALQRLADQ